jgi:hypothetical protein
VAALVVQVALVALVASLPRAAVVVAMAAEPPVRPATAATTLLGRAAALPGRLSALRVLLEQTAVAVVVVLAPQAARVARERNGIVRTALAAAAAAVAMVQTQQVARARFMALAVVPAVTMVQSAIKVARVLRASSLSPTHQLQAQHTMIVSACPGHRLRH